LATLGSDCRSIPCPDADKGGACHSLGDRAAESSVRVSERKDGVKSERPRIVSSVLPGGYSSYGDSSAHSLLRFCSTHDRSMSTPSTASRDPRCAPVQTNRRSGTQHAIRCQLLGLLTSPGQCETRGCAEEGLVLPTLLETRAWLNSLGL